MKWLLLLGSFSLGMCWVGELRQEAGQEGPGLAATENGWCGGLTRAKQPGWGAEDPYDEQRGRWPEDLKWEEGRGREAATMCTAQRFHRLAPRRDTRTGTESLVMSSSALSTG